MTITISRGVPVLIGILLVPAAPAQATRACTANVTTASDAAAKAGWIIEGNVDMVATFPTEGLSATLSDTICVVRTTDASGRTFMAIREPAGADPAMAGTFATGMARAGVVTRQFQGVIAMLAVSTPRALEQKYARGEAALRERFYQSLVCD